MKYTLVFLLALIPFLAFSQAQITKDSTAIRFVNGSAFEDRYLEYDNKDAAILTTFIGDSATLNNYITNTAIQTANNFAAHAKEFINQGKTLNQIRAAKNALEAATGLDLYRAIIALYYTEFVDEQGVDKSWDYRTGGTVTQLQVRLLAGGGLRFSGLPGAGGTKLAHMLGDSWIRINDYPSGSDTHFYKVRKNRWFNSDRTVELRLTGLNINANSNR